MESHYMSLNNYFLQDTVNGELNQYEIVGPLYGAASLY